MAEKGAGFALRRFPARAHLIAVKGRLWVWDTGYSNHFTEHAGKGVFRIYSTFVPACFDKREFLVAQLARQGVGRADITGVILSHFHGDHIAGARDFPDVSFYCSGAGWNALKNVSGFRALRQGFVPGLLPNDFERRVRFVETFGRCRLPADLAPFTCGWELPESGGEVFLVDLPGHAKGHIGAFVLTESGWVMLAGDAAWTSRNYTAQREPAAPARIVMDDYGRYVHTLDLLRQTHEKGVVKIVLCHEEAGL